VLSELERFATFSDDYVLTAEDTDTLPSVVCGRVSLEVRKQEGRLVRLVVGGEEVKTAGDIRAVLRKHPEPPKDKWLDFHSSLAASIAHLMEIAMIEQSHSRVMRKMLFEKGVITREEFSNLVAAERDETLYHVRDELFPVFQSLYPEQFEQDE
jgi:hypothetical protein